MQYWIPTREPESKFYLRISQLSINIIISSLHLASLNTLIASNISFSPRITNISQGNYGIRGILVDWQSIFRSKRRAYLQPGYVNNGDVFRAICESPLHDWWTRSPDIERLYHGSTRQIEISYKYRRKKRISPVLRKGVLPIFLFNVKNVY